MLGILVLYQLSRCGCASILATDIVAGVLAAMLSNLASNSVTTYYKLVTKYEHKKLSNSIFDTLCLILLHEILTYCLCLLINNGFLYLVKKNAS